MTVLNFFFKLSNFVPYYVSYRIPATNKIKENILRLQKMNVAANWLKVITIESPENKFDYSPCQLHITQDIALY